MKKLLFITLSLFLLFIAQSSTLIIPIFYLGLKTIGLVAMLLSLYMVTHVKGKVFPALMGLNLLVLFQVLYFYTQALVYQLV